MVNAMVDGDGYGCLQSIFLKIDSQALTNVARDIIIQVGT